MAAPRRAPGAESASSQRRVDRALALARSAHLARRQREVGAGEAAHELRRVVRQPEPRDDLVADHRRRRRGAGEHARARQLRQQMAELQVIGPEVVAPFADAVRLVDGDQRAAQLREQSAEGRRSQALGRDVQEPQLAALGAREPPSDLRGLERRRQIGRGHAARGERIDLVVHQRDERRDDQRGAGEQRGGELVAETLAASRRRHQQDPAAAEELLDRLALPRAEVGVAEPAQAGVEIELGYERCGHLGLAGTGGRFGPRP